MTAGATATLGLRSRETALAMLAWYEVLFLLCVALALAVVISRFVWPLEQIAYVRHLPLLLTLPTFVLALFGRHLRAAPRAASGTTPLAVAWPFAMLALLIVGGSLYARMVNGIQTSFLNLGLYMGLIFVGATLVLHSADPKLLVRGFCRLLLWGASVMTLGLIVYFRRREVYHEEIFLVIPLAVYAFLAWCSLLARWGGLLFFLFAALLSAKNTSYLVALATMAYLAVHRGLRDTGSIAPLQRLWRYYLAFMLLLLAGIGVAYVLHYHEALLPSGNLSYRSHTYAQAWSRFLDSPWWGNLFTVESVEKFTLYTVGAARNVLPTHSDVMDLLANGGVLAIGLWALGLLRIGGGAYRRLLAPRCWRHPWAPEAHTLAMVSLAGVITYAFNPIMLQPGMAYLMWLSLGLLLGLSLRSETVAVRKEESCNANPSSMSGRPRP